MGVIPACGSQAVAHHSSAPDTLFANSQIAQPDYWATFSAITSIPQSTVGAWHPGEGFSSILIASRTEIPVNSRTTLRDGPPAALAMSKPSATFSPWRNVEGPLARRESVRLAEYQGTV